MATLLTQICFALNSKAEGREFLTSTDSEVIAQLVATAPGSDWGERMAYVMRPRSRCFLFDDS